MSGTYTDRDTTVSGVGTTANSCRHSPRSTYINLPCRASTSSSAHFTSHNHNHNHYNNPPHTTTLTQQHSTCSTSKLPFLSWPSSRLYPSTPLLLLLSRATSLKSSRTLIPSTKSFSLNEETLLDDTNTIPSTYVFPVHCTKRVLTDS